MAQDRECTGRDLTADEESFLDNDPLNGSLARMPTSAYPGFLKH